MIKPIGVIIGPLGHSTIKEFNSKENMKLLSSITIEYKYNSKENVI